MRKIDHLYLINLRDMRRVDLPGNSIWKMIEKDRDTIFLFTKPLDITYPRTLTSKDDVFALSFNCSIADSLSDDEATDLYSKSLPLSRWRDHHYIIPEYDHLGRFFITIDGVTHHITKIY